jgi:CRISPR-associated endonuclease/helicase Cas3
MNYSEFFKQATGQDPYEYQIRLAESEPWPDLLEAPTGVGKTEAIVLAWLWRRHYAKASVRATTPRRLAYCLPMRVLVEQTRDRVTIWLKQLGWGHNVGVYILMGGESEDEWDLYPEKEALLIGTQDMLLSRALNRGYALGRARWPMPYALLNNDCQWVFDEVQLMGSGLATTAQLAALRDKFATWGNSHSLWISATIQPEWLGTVDHRAKLPHLVTHVLGQNEWDQAPLSVRLNANKTLTQTKFTFDELKKLASEIVNAHQSGTMTLVVVNTVDKAVALYRAIKTIISPIPKRGDKHPRPLKAETQTLLLHSRFRPPDRRANITKLISIQTTGGIVVATQVIEAGVDISARVLFTELAPWPSLVQRFGRCNRKGEFEQADVKWIDVDEKRSAPYDSGELKTARSELKLLECVGPRALRDHLKALSNERRAKLYPYAPVSVIRRATVVELFDTTPDLTNADIDISSYIRENDEHDVQVFWRIWKTDPNTPLQPAPHRDELCPAPLNKVARAWLESKERWQWNFLEGCWQPAKTLVPGQVYLLAANARGYSSEFGFTTDTDQPMPMVISDSKAADANDTDPLSQGCKIWQTIAGHTNQVVEQLRIILDALGELLTEEERSELLHAARWHDWGKAYYVFQDALTAKAVPDFPLPEGHLWGKSSKPSDGYAHPGFRHELASAVAMLSLSHSDLACYIAATHHGKVRLSIRSLPTEKQPPNGRRFARGVWEGDILPSVKLGGGIVTPEVTLSLACMEMGRGSSGSSWAERALKLRDSYGPYRLAYLEALLCAADRRASANPHSGGDA